MQEKEKRPEVDIVNTVLEDCIIAFPVSSFVISLYQQYQKRGFLSKKQLQGLHDKASKITDISPGKLATLQAMIKKMPTRFKSELPTNPHPIYEKDKSTGDAITAILEKYPHHKRVLYLKAKYENNESLTTAELADLKRFRELLK
ncbi:MAG TPA: hypothetical protein VEV87_04280 [Chitinophagaceae bacterium]|nr:hypothetical protein [Chitinophagaceae bacterium]